MLPLCWTILFACATFAADEPAASRAIQPGAKVLFLGDSIVAPGMFSYGANFLLEKRAPGQNISFRSFGIAGTTARTIVPHLTNALQDTSYDWIILNFGHNDSNGTPEEFRTNAVALLKQIRSLSSAKLAWMTVLGNEPELATSAPGYPANWEAAAKGRAKQDEIARVTREVAQAEDVLCLPTREAFTALLKDRERQGLPLSFTIDGVHPNLLGNWLVTAVILRTLGFKLDAAEVEILESDATINHGRWKPVHLEKPMKLSFKDIPLALTLIPPPSRQIVCPERTGVALDGKLDEWKDVPGCVLSAPRHVTMELIPGDPTAYAATLHACHDAGNLYLAFQVKAPSTDEGKWFPEIIEVLMDARKDSSTSANVWRQERGLTQYAFHREFSDKSGDVCATASANGDKSQGEGLRAAARKTADGYILEAAIPLSNFKQVPIGKGAALPFEWAVSFTDQAINLDWLGLMGRCSSTMAYGVLVME